MRQVSKDITTSFLAGVANTKGNSWTDGMQLQLHNNTIAKKENGRLYISNCGFETNTTKERLNAIGKLYHRKFNLYQKKGQWYIQMSEKTQEFPSNEWFEVG